jgi:hypothetical protein
VSSSPSLPLTGGCGCGAVRFELSAPPDVALYCHCTRCQRRSGTAAAPSARVAPESVTLLSGAEHLRGWAPEGGLEKVFCVLCGSALFGRTPGTEDITVVRMGAFDEDPGIRPVARQFTAYAAPWEPIPDDGLTLFPERASRGDDR